MLELFQAEWCPFSARVRQRLTELGIDCIIHQVPVEREARSVLRAAVGADTIPALRVENGSAIVGEKNILAYLGEHAVETPEAEAHRQRAAKARRTYLEEGMRMLATRYRLSVETTRFGGSNSRVPRSVPGGRKGENHVDETAAPPARRDRRCRART